MSWLRTWWVLSVLILILLIGGVYAIVNGFPRSQQTQVACTQEAKQCPDGSYVGRTGVNCEFSACASPSPTPAPPSPLPIPPPVGEIGKGVLKGTMTIGPICPVEQVGNPCKPTPETFAAHKVSVYSSDRSRIIATLIPDANGNFSTTLPVTTYIVDVAHQSVGSVQGAPATIKIESGKTTVLTIDIDTGIR